MGPKQGRKKPFEREEPSRTSRSPPNARILSNMFKEALQEAVENSGGYAGLLMDFEGIPVESFVGPESPFDIEVVGAEISVLVKQILRAAEMLEAGGTEEVSFRSERMTTLVRIIDQNYFVAMTMAPNGNAGRGRYALRLIAPELAVALA